ncbi:rubrerythrin family protein [Paraclostridium ghonii]|uniref:Rubrerythrin n=1 Tax=Paraclostridium ghonii TaxID=29358 RepID=A0ABU0N3M7_9FIRM|nr:rubrerythrin family protein [Paeniclostridium ghonii]MDQ0557776.1 rubrerythrin [Paeniclostridium ghonii]
MNTLKDSKTKYNLMKAFAGESQARNRYTFGASLAKSQNLELIYRVFNYTSDQEKAHAWVFYKHLKDLSGQSITIDTGYPVDVYNDLEKTLRTSQQHEYEEWDKIYKEFAQIAKEEGFMSVSNSFEKISEIEKIHGDRFGRFADAIKSNTLFKSDKEEKWICLNCGHIHTGKEVPNACPVCQYPQGYFILYSISPFEN